MSKVAATTVVLVVVLIITALADAGLVGDAHGWGISSGIVMAVWVVSLLASFPEKGDDVHRRHKRHGR